MLNITITCDKCDRAFIVENVQIGDKVECPHCGDVNVVRGAKIQSRSPVAHTPGPSGNVTPTTSIDTRAAAQGLPPLDGPEVDVMRLRPAMMRAKPFSFAGLILGAVGGLIGGIITFATGLIPVAVILWIISLACLVTLGWWKITSMHEGLIITTRRIIDREGLLSKNTSEILLKDIRNVVVRQTFVQRIFNVGTIALSSSADQGVEVFMEHLAKPNEVKRIIDLYR
jgi:hypothetical protein